VALILANVCLLHQERPLILFSVGIDINVIMKNYLSRVMVHRIIRSAADLLRRIELS
jgi:hypothetical protein